MRIQAALFVMILGLTVFGCSRQEPPDAAKPVPDSGSTAEGRDVASDEVQSDCAADSDCGAAQYCFKPIGGCELENGTCADRTEMCTRDWRPVCGCDAKTYGNLCGAASAGQNVDYEGECG